jgi:succinyl-CoA synthetase beta subunit
MNIHEYQGKEILRKYQVKVPLGKVAATADQALAVAREIGGSAWVVKAQIHAGGRGKGGGVKLAKNLPEVEKYAREIIGMRLVTPQTGPQGKMVSKVLVEQASTIKKEYYLSMVVDRARPAILLMASAEGGMEIEKIAATSPEKIVKIHIPTESGFMPYQARQVCFQLGMVPALIPQMTQMIKGLNHAFRERDCSLVEINPLIETAEGELVALDVKINFDDCAMFRQEEVKALRDVAEEDVNEVVASQYDLSYISLSGNIGCLVNGAGLAMATMDIIKLHGGSPANFLDVGGSASPEKVTAAFRIILNDPHIKAILVNIFGGIMRCDVIAEGIIAAAKELSLQIPLVVRLNGTNVEKGKELLQNSGLKIISAATLEEAAKLAVRAVQ